MHMLLTLRLFSTTADGRHITRTMFREIDAPAVPEDTVRALALQSRRNGPPFGLDAKVEKTTLHLDPTPYYEVMMRASDAGMPELADWLMAVGWSPAVE